MSFPAIRNREGQLMAEAVADASTAHIASLVSRQKNSKPPPSRPVRRSYFSRRGGSFSRHRSRGSRNSYSSNSNVSFQPIEKTFKVDRVSSTSSHSRSSSNVRPRSPPYPPPKAKAVISLPGKKFEIAPRFVRLNQRKMEASIHATSPPGSPPRSLTPPSHFSPVKREMSQHRNTTSASGSQETNDMYNGNHIQRTPRPLLSRSAFGRLDRFKQQLDAASTAKEYVEIYAKANGYEHRYTTNMMGQKKKSFVSNLVLGGRSYRSYPNEARTAEEAEEIAAQNAVESIQENKEFLAMLPETPITNAEEIAILLSRIEENSTTVCSSINYLNFNYKIIKLCDKPSGMFIKGIEIEYENKFNESLPDGWLDLVKASSIVDVDEVAVAYGKVPDGKNFIVKPAKIFSSGSTTPSEASATNTEQHDLENEDFLSRKHSLSDTHIEVPELTIPDGNEWGVYITNVSSFVSARLIDHDGDFYNMSQAMSAFYGAQTLPVHIVYEGHLYAAAGEDLVMNRVLTIRIINSDLVECYFVDEGIYAEVKKSDLQELNEEFLTVPYQAIHLSLEGLEDLEPFIKSEYLEPLGCIRHLLLLLR
ncbi:tudor domain-containing protein 7A, partial [Caerostris extrusa]